VSTVTDPHLRAVPPSLAPLFDPEQDAPLHTPPADEPPTPDPAWSTDRLSPDAAVLHSLACACHWGGDAEGHGVDFEELAAKFVTRALERDGRQHEPAPPVKHPVEAKVSVGLLFGTVTTVVAAVTTTILTHPAVFGPLIGSSPWAGPLVLLVGAAVTAVQARAAYQAPHTPRATDGAK
jgi:hypothetical protein